MKARRFTCLVGCVLTVIIAPGLVRAQGHIEGQVVNGTTGRPVANAKVQLLQPREGMQQVAATSTDARGHFAFSESGIDAKSFYLLQANFGDAAYNSPVQFDANGNARADVTVYDSTKQPPALGVRQARILLRAAGNRIEVEELFALQNSSNPPRTYVNASGTFQFRIPPGIGKPRAAVAGVMNMPLPQAAVKGKKPGEFFILYPLKPKLTVVMIGYETDYSGSGFDYGDSVPYPIEQAELDVLPASLSVSSPVFKSAGSDPDSGGQKFLAAGLDAGAPLAVTLSGEAAPAPASAETNSSDEQVKVTPDSMTRLGVPLLVCFLLVLLWALGVRTAKEWPRWRARQAAGILLHKGYGAKADQLINSLADLDELFAAGKIVDKKYWKERLELKAKLIALMKKVQAPSPESYAARRPPR